MAESTILLQLASVVVLGVAAQWLAWKVRVPSILLLLIVGFVAGPVTGFLKPDALLGDLLLPIVSLAVGLILFEGGLTLTLGEIRGHGRVVTLLVTMGALVTWVGAGAAAYFLLDFPLGLSALIGAILIVTGPTVVGPLLRHVQPRGQSGNVIKWEGILIDPVGALVAVLVFEFILAGAGAEATSAFFTGLGRAVAVGAGVGFAGALALVVLIRLHLLPEHLQSPLTVAAVVGAFTVSNVTQSESGLIAVTLMGVLLANQRFVETRHILEFKENLRVLLIASLFILLSARLSIADLRGLGMGAVVFLAALILVVRPVMVALATWGSPLSWRERALVAWMGPRGIVAAAVASLFGLRLQEAGYPGAGDLVPVTFVVIVGTVAVYGLTAAPLARVLKLAEPDPQGVLFVGAHPLARSMARALTELNHRVKLVDHNPGNVKAARLVGLDAVQVDVLAPDATGDLDLSGIGKFIAITPNDEVNSLASLRFKEKFDRVNTFQVPPPRPSGTHEKETRVPRHLRGRLLFHPDKTLEKLQEIHRDGGKVLSMKVMHDFDLAAFTGVDCERAVPLFVSDASGRLRVVTAKEKLLVRTGDTLVYLARPQAEEALHEDASTDAERLGEPGI